MLVHQATLGIFYQVRLCTPHIPIVFNPNSQI
jgi:hypothetical protein